MRPPPPSRSLLPLLLLLLLHPALLLLVLPVTAASPTETVELEPKAAADIAPAAGYFEHSSPSLRRRLVPADDQVNPPAVAEPVLVPAAGDAAGVAPPNTAPLPPPANQAAAAAPAAATPIPKPPTTEPIGDAIPPATAAAAAAAAAEATPTPLPLNAANKKRDMMCDSFSVDDVLGELDDIAICATDWARFYDRANGASWNGRTLGSQSEMLSSFCASPCGPLFDDRLKGFRDTCQAGKGKMMEAQQAGVEEVVIKVERGGEEEEGKWVDVPEYSRDVYRMLGFVGTFGCTQDKNTGMLCAELTVRSLSSSASAQKLPPKGFTSTGDNRRKKKTDTKKQANLAVQAAAAGKALVKEHKCAYYTSCCFGEMMKTLQLAEQEKVMDDLERECPGAEVAGASSCVRSAAKLG